MTLAFRLVCISLLAAPFLSPAACDDDDDDADDGDTGGDDVDEFEIPRFVEHDYIDLSKIDRISRFRSGVGHDYSDEFETCRSMKHYFVSGADADWSAVSIYSPVDGEVTRAEEGWAGKQIHIRSANHPELDFILFHVDAPDLEAGGAVRAGQKIGTHIGDRTWSDIAVGAHGSDGYRLVSFFDVMTGALFETYRARGASGRGDFVISKDARDADPLTCHGEEFAGEGRIENWVELD